MKKGMRERGAGGDNKCGCFLGEPLRQKITFRTHLVLTKTEMNSLF